MPPPPPLLNQLNSQQIQGKRNNKRRVVDELLKNKVVVVGIVGGCDVAVVKKNDKVVAVVKESFVKSIRMNEFYKITRFKMMLLSGVIDSQKIFPVHSKILQDLIFAMRDLTDAYHQDIPGSQRLSDGTQLLVVDSEYKNILDCSRYIHKQLYPLVQLKPDYDDSLLCHYEFVLDLFDGKACSS